MSSMEDKVKKLLADYMTQESDDKWDYTTMRIVELFKSEGYIKLPNAQNITITTSDNPNDKLMTREQWEAEHES